MAGRGLRRTLTISDPNKSDFKDEGGHDDGNNETTTNTDSHNSAAFSPGSGRTLMDIIREEQKMKINGSSGSIRNSEDGTINWKSFTDRIRLRRAGAAFTDLEPYPKSDPKPDPKPNPNQFFTRSMTVRTSDNMDPDDASDLPLPIPKRPDENSGNSGMSLMALLEGGGFGDDEDEDEEDEDDENEEEEEGEGEELYHACCVCMVRHKGAAFIPCGHTFCRLCSRELWVNRGSCPLCNGFILEILDIF